MKFLILALSLSLYVSAAPTEKKKTLPISKAEEMVKADKKLNEKIKALEKKPEDCDEKAKKPVEIKPEAISLTGNTGCSLE